MAPVKPVTAVMQMDSASKMAVKKHVVTESAVSTRCVRSLVAPVKPVTAVMQMDSVSKMAVKKRVVTGSVVPTRCVRSLVAPVRPMKTAIAKANVNAYQIAWNISAAKTRFVERKTVALVVLKRFARKVNVALKTAPIASVVQIQIAESLVALATPVPPATALADVYPSPLAPALMAGA